MMCRPAGRVSGATLLLALLFAGLLVVLLLAQPTVAQPGRRHPLHDRRDLEADEQDAFLDAELPVDTDPVARGLVDRARAQFCATSATRHNAPCGDPEVEFDDPLVLAGPAGPLTSYVIRLPVRVSYGAGAVTYLYITDGTHSILEEIHARFLSGMGGISNAAGVARWEWDHSVLVVQLDQHENDEDMGICQRDGSYSSEVFMCVARPDGPSCGHAQTRYLSYEETERPCDSVNARTVSRFRGYQARLTVSATHLAFTRRPGTPQAPPRTLPRRISVDEFVSQPATRWPRPASPAAAAP